MDLAVGVLFFKAVERLEMPEEAAQVVLPLLETDVLSCLSECLWLSQA